MEKGRDWRRGVIAWGEARRITDLNAPPPVLICVARVWEQCLLDCNRKTE